MLAFDFSEYGKHLKAGLSWVSLKDASTARTIISTVVGGIISLTVFSFSMVMIVLNQAASQMSNRILSSMIENRFQQIVLGFYIGTIVYALFLLSTIRDLQNGVLVPAISIYLLLLLTVTDIFLFIYFLDYVTQTVKYETVIQRVQFQTYKTMQVQFLQIPAEEVTLNDEPFVELVSDTSGYYQGFDQKQLIKTAQELDITIVILHKKGSFLIKGSSFLKVYGRRELDDNCKKKIFLAIDFFLGQPIDRNAEYGFRHLTEVALKALSPGINDPATAVLSINALSDLFAYRLNHYLPTVLKDATDKVRVVVTNLSFEELFEECMYPIWHYGKEDRYIQNAILLMMDQLEHLDVKKSQFDFFNKLRAEILKQSGLERFH